MEDRGIKSHPLARRAVKTGQGVKVTRACTIRKPASELFQFWRNLENLPRFMQHVVAVEKISDVESRWTVKAPGGRTVIWNAVIFNEEPNRLIAWRNTLGRVRDDLTQAIELERTLAPLRPAGQQQELTDTADRLWAATPVELSV